MLLQAMSAGKCAELNGVGHVCYRRRESRSPASSIFPKESNTRQGNAGQLFVHVRQFPHPIGALLRIFLLT